MCSYYQLMSLHEADEPPIASYYQNAKLRGFQALKLGLKHNNTFDVFNVSKYSK